MANDRQPVCFTCSQPVAEPPRLNRLESGEPCPTCQDRLLDLLPPLLPGVAPVTVPEGEEALPPEPIETFSDEHEGPAA